MALLFLTSARNFLLVVCSILGLLAQPSPSTVPCFYGEHCAVLLSPSSSSFISLTRALAHSLSSMAKPSRPLLSEMLSLPPMWLFQKSFLLQLQPHHFHCLYSTFWGAAFLLYKLGCWSYHWPVPLARKFNRYFLGTKHSWSFTHFPVFLARILLVISLCVSCFVYHWTQAFAVGPGWLSLWLWKVFGLSISCIACQVFHVASVGFWLH